MSRKDECYVRMVSDKPSEKSKPSALDRARRLAKKLTPAERLELAAELMHRIATRALR